MPRDNGAPQGDSNVRAYQPSIAELVDRLTIDQIKEVVLSEDKASYAAEMRDLAKDIDALIKDGGIQLSARLIRIVIVLAQMNLHIWHFKDQMQTEPERYSELLTLCHQLNGIKNQMKNLLLEESANPDQAARHTNVSIDGLQGWDISI